MEDAQKYSFDKEALKQYSKLPIPNLLKLFKKVNFNSKKPDQFLQKLDERYTLFFGHNQVLSAKEPYGKMYPAIFSVMIGFGIADTNKEHTHNKLLVQFLEESNQLEVLKDFNNFWKDPFNSRIRAVPAIIIYNSYNELHTDHVIKTKNNPKLIILGNVKETEDIIECVELDALSLNWKNFFYCLR